MTVSQPLDPAHRDPATAPGDDFYQHANGGWLAANPVPPQYGAWGAFHEVQLRNELLLHELLESAASTGDAQGSPQQMAGDFFASGMDVEQVEATGIEPLRPWLDQVEAMRDVGDLLSIAAAIRPHGVSLLFGTSVAADFEDSSRYLLYLSQGGLGLPERDYYLRDDERSVALLEAYEGHIAAMLELLGGSDDPGAAATTVLEVEKTLARASLGAIELRDVDRTTNKTPVAALAGIAPDLAISDYLEQLRPGIESVNLNHPGFFAATASLLKEVPIPVWRSYLRWHIVSAVASSLPARFEDEAFRFYGQMLGGQREQKERWKRVLAAASADIGQQVSKLFVAAAFKPEAKQRCEVMVGHLLEAMSESIRSLDWMGDNTKVEALEKLAGFRTKIGYPETWRDYTGLVIDRGPYLTNRMRAAAFEFERRLAKLGTLVESEWELPPHVVNAYYHPLYNEIVFPAGILQAPFFDADADDCVNYGGIGSVIGHEITHGFDDQGSKFDAVGNLRNWWTVDDRAEFERRADGLVEMFGGYSVGDDLNVNGELTLGENIADLGGLTLAFRALQGALGSSGPSIDGLTDEQRFFLSYATIWRTNYTDEYLRLIVTTDPHSPGRFRCNGPLANFPEFLRSFAIDGDSQMKRSDDEIVRIW